jgi:adenosylcobinamide kinase/adenosylcobinamide-phosphate guanylyltransferase
MYHTDLILILGGARAGKSAFALQLARERESSDTGDICFIATAEALDEEMRFRIARHRAERPSHWLTIEEPRYLDKAVNQSRNARIIIVDCLTLFISNWVLDSSDYYDCEREILQIIDSLVKAAAKNNQSLIFVSNEVGLGLVPETPLGRAFRDVLGRVNQQVARAATHVYLVVAGLPLQIKSKAIESSLL